MPYDEPDPGDPTVIVGVGLPGDAESTRELAWALAEEFASLGHSEAQIMRLFKTPFYAGAHRAFLAIGEEETEAIIRECVGFWGRVRFVDRVPAGSPALGQAGAPVRPPGAWAAAAPVRFKLPPDATKEI